MVKAAPVQGTGVEVTLPKAHSASFDGCASLTVGGLLLQSRKNFGSAGSPDATCEAGAINREKTARHNTALAALTIWLLHGLVAYIFFTW
jgi:hypothetical protein